MPGRPTGMEFKQSENQPDSQVDNVATDVQGSSMWGWHDSNAAKQARLM